MTIDTLLCAFSCKQRASLRLSVHCCLVRDISATVVCEVLQKWYIINPENPQKRGSLKASEEESQKRGKEASPIIAWVTNLPLTFHLLAFGQLWCEMQNLNIVHKHRCNVLQSILF